MIFVALGSNLSGAYSSPEQLLKASLFELGETGIVPYRVSPLYKTAPIGPSGQPDYVNAVAAVRCRLAPRALLNRLHDMENVFGRQRDIVWGARTLDLDLLDYHGQIMVQAPVLPHPRLAERAFVLRPLADIAPGWRHPQSGRQIADLLAALPKRARDGVRLLAAS